MPYPNYYPATYQPYYPQPPVQQPVQTQPQTSILWVGSAAEAQMYPVAPNNAVTLWNQNEPVVYLKQADASGKPTIKVYDLVERTETAPTPTEGKHPDYATKDELAAVLGAVKGYDGTLAAIKSDIDTIKGDMYGIAGKKKAPAKKEEE